MKKTKLKDTLRPIIKECVTEVLLEEGLLSNIVFEVAKGLSSSLIVEEKQKLPDKKQHQLLEQQRLELQHEKHEMLKEQRKKILNATGFNTNIFENTEPLATSGQEDQNYSSLAGTDPGDAGVDISGIMALGGRKWSKLV